jgi:pyruvate-ferredoxin/flavodoxin oxidoreductase
MSKNFQMMDGNTAAAHVAYALSEVAAIFPITPSSPMGELADAWSAQGRKNIFGENVHVVEMQSEGGASGAVHGSLSAGALTTTFTASQGLMLMLPNMHKIAGELLPAVFHVSARSLACQSLSIFGDHSDVMAARNTGFGLLASNSVQEVMDLALVTHLSAIESSVPFVHFFDGFRTSHEIQKIEVIDYEDMAKMVNYDYIEKFRERALNPECPFLKVGAQNPDVYFQGRETVNKFYEELPAIVQKYMDQVGELTGRKYNLFDYVGAADAEKVIVAMGSGCEAIEEAINYLTKKGEKVGLVKVRLYRPFSVEHFRKALPKTVKKIAVLDRTKEPGAPGEPLYLDVVDALKGENILIIGGRYGLSSKEFNPSMVKAVYDHLDGKAFHGFTVGINDDVTGTSVEIKEEINAIPEGTVSCKFWGFGSDGTVGASKNTIKIIGEGTDMYAQGYFEYDSKKSGGITISHLRFGKEKIQSTYLVKNADFIACHNPAYIGRYDLLNGIKENGVFLLNSEFRKEEVFENLTRDMQETIINKKIKVYNVNALKIANEVGLGKRINTVMQTAFFLVSGILPREKAIDMIKKHIEKTYGKKGEEVVAMNIKAVDKAVEAVEEVHVPNKLPEKYKEMKKLIPDDAPEFAKKVIEKVMQLKGDEIPVSDMPIDGAVPTGTTALEKRGVAPFVPRWIADKCIQCNQCSFVCPHAAIRPKLIEKEALKDAPKSFYTLDAMGKDKEKYAYRMQVFINDCQGCVSCVEICPKGALEMKPIAEERARGEEENEKFFLAQPEDVLGSNKESTVKGSQFKQPLFEFSGACAGCGETPYIKLVTQLFGDRMIVANATGCSSIYGGTFPTVPYCKNKDGEGPAWANSLFEDNAEYGFGMRLAVESNRLQLKSLVEKVKDKVDGDLKAALLKSLELWDKTDAEAKANSKKIKSLLPQAIEKAEGELKTDLKRIRALASYFVDKSVWIIGGDGWAYDIGYGGLDHVLAANRNVNVLVLDTEVYSNTGGQSSKATPLGSIAKFAAAGKPTPKKDLALMATTYGYVYVTTVSMGANKAHYLQRILEAEAYEGPSLIIAYSPCINHQYNLQYSQEHEKLAVETGYWPLFHYDPRLAKEGKNPFVLDFTELKKDPIEFLQTEKRYSMLKKINPTMADKFYADASEWIKNRHARYRHLAGLD